MTFSIALSGLSAASTDLDVTGNNIANVSTTGFRRSRAEFGDVVANSFLAAGVDTVGSGVSVVNIGQQFDQGNISFTDNELDLAISGDGFFVLDDDGTQTFTRNGIFGVDAEGFVVSNTGDNLQGFPADGEGGVVTGVLSDLQVDVDTIAPQLTTDVVSSVNLPADALVLADSGTLFTASTTDPGTGLSVPTGTIVQPPAILGTTNGVPSQSLDVNFADGSIQTVVTAADASAAETAALFNDVSGVSATASTTAIIPAAGFSLGTGSLNINGIAFTPGPSIPGPPPSGGIIELANDINSSGLLNTDAVIDTAGNLIITNSAGVNLNFSITAGPAATVSGPIDIIAGADLAGPPVTIDPTVAGATQATVAGTIELTLDDGITLANTPASITIPAGGLAGLGGATVDINGVAFPSAAGDLAVLAADINASVDPALLNVTATFDVPTGNLLIQDTTGALTNIAIGGGTGAESFQFIEGTDPTVTPITLDNDPASVAIADNFTTGSGFGVIAGFTPIAFTNNTFDPTDPGTFNASTSVTIFDSLGVPHVLTQFFVAEPGLPGDPDANVFTLFVQVDGEDVGDPNPSLPPPLNTQPTQASFTLVFDSDGTLNTDLSDPVVITNFQPLDADGNPNGALGPVNIIDGGNVLPLPDPPTSSNFVIDLSESTQFGGPFAVNNVAQNGFTTGQLVGLNFDATGILFAQFSNGESTVLGQVALADFNNVQGLAPVGDTQFVESAESGEPIIGAPGTATLGAIQSASLEESNVDLSEELVNLIIAQRNFQANAQTIETADTVTQTIINI